MIHNLNTSSDSSDDSSNHSHENKSVLDKLSVSEDGDLLYDGKKIQSLADTPQSAYDIAVEHGFSGTEEEWIDSLKGDPGEDGEAPTTEDVVTALKSDTDFLGSLKGEKGDPGVAGKAPTIQEITTALKSDSDFMESLKGNEDSGNSIKITFSATEPTSVPAGEIVMVYEE